MFRNSWILILTFVLSAFVEVAAQGRPQFTVVLYNDAGIPERVVNKAKAITENIYRDAGVELVWKNRAGSVPGGTEFFLRIVPRSLSLPGEDFGIAFVGSDGRGVQADVFYSGIDRMAKDSSVSPAEIMGHVMAHELGHLLLGMNSHSPLGIMQSRWSARQLRQMSMGTLKFDKWQSGIIGSRLLRAHDMHQVEAELRAY